MIDLSHLHLNLLIRRAWLLAEVMGHGRLFQALLVLM
jgi:hypothetical protein